MPCARPVTGPIRLALSFADKVYTGEMFDAKEETNNIGNAPPRSAFLPLARAWHPALRLRHGQVDDPSGRLAGPHFLAPFRPHTAPAARDPAGAPG